ncbi:efflux RND transporter periplasmic adaptor subunit [Pseudoalteromonas piscicida]|nr:efflux RND transporter periplasmic adaptor subunit [Pseudoalteromonas piscicida]
MFFKLVFLLLTAVLSGCSEGPKAKPIEKQVTPAVFTAVELAETVPARHFYSRIVGSDVIYVASLSEGRIESSTAYSGKVVKQGEVLASLYSPYLKAQLREKQALLTSAKRASQQAKLDFARTEKLFAKKLVSDSSLDVARLELTTREQQVRSAEALVEEAQNALNENQIVAQSDGIVTDVYARSGDVVNSGQAIFQLQTLTTLKAEFLLPEQEYIGLSINQPVTIFVPSINKTLTGKVIEKSLPSMTVGRLFKLTVDLFNQNAELVGLLTRLELAISAAPPFKVPASAVHYDVNDQAYVFVAKPEFKRINVKVLGNQGDKVLVTAPQLADNNVLTTSAAKLGFNLAMLGSKGHGKK